MSERRKKWVSAVAFQVFLLGGLGVALFLSKFHLAGIVFLVLAAAALARNLPRALRYLRERRDQSRWDAERRN